MAEAISLPLPISLNIEAAPNDAAAAEAVATPRAGDNGVTSPLPAATSSDAEYATAASAFGTTTDDETPTREDRSGSGVDASAEEENGVSSPDVASSSEAGGAGDDKSPSGPTIVMTAPPRASLPQQQQSSAATSSTGDSNGDIGGLACKGERHSEVEPFRGTLLPSYLTASHSVGCFSAHKTPADQPEKEEWEKNGDTDINGHNNHRHHRVNQIRHHHRGAASSAQDLTTMSASASSNGVTEGLELSAKLRESMFTVDNIDFDEPLIDPGEKYKDLLYPATKTDDDGNEEGAVVLTCDDNPNLEATALLKNSNSKVTVTISPEGLRWVQHSVPIIPSGLKAQVAAETSSALLKVRFEVSSSTSYIMNCVIPLEDVVIAKVGHWTSHEKCQRKSDKTVTVFALDKRANSVWAYCTFYFEFDSTVTSKVWVHTINRNLLDRFPQRPKCLLVFVNPIGGKGNALTIFKKQVAPLFELSQIETEVITSKGGSYIEDFLAVFRFGTIDGVLAVGGDGTFSQVVNGLLRRAQNDANCQLDLPPSPQALNKNTPLPLSPSSIPVGHIPAGSQNTLAYSTLGAMEPITATLHVILGTRMGLDVMAVHDYLTGKFLRFCNVVLGYGNAADTAVDGDKNRWAGPWRYYVAAAKTLQRHKMYYGKLEFLPASHSGHAKDGVRCWSGCKICEKSRSYCAEKGWSEGKEEDDGWKSCSAKFHSIASIPLTGRSRLRPEGDLPYTHLADGTTELLVVSECTRRDLVKMVLGKQGLLGSKIVTSYRARAFRFTPLNDKMEDLLTPIGGAKSGEDGSGGDAGVEVGKPADEEEEGDVVKENGAVGDAGGGVVSDTFAASNELEAPSNKGGGDEAASSQHQPEAASPAPMTSSSSFTGDSSLPTIQRPTCLPTHSTSKKELSSWTSDGEMDFSQKAITVFVHCQLLTIFGHGVEKPHDK